MDKHIYALTAIHRIHYQRLKRQFSVPCNTAGPGSTARLILDILKEPRAALYVQHWKIDESREEWGLNNQDPTGDSIEHVEYSPADMALLEEAMRKSHYEWYCDHDAAIQDMPVGHEDPLIVLALTLLPNLASIDFEDSSSHYIDIVDIIRNDIEDL